MTTCLWCKEPLRDGYIEAGGKSPAWEVDGDYGCDAHPLSNEEGVWGHETREEVGAIILMANFKSETKEVELFRHTTDGGAVYMTDNHDFKDATVVIRLDGGAVLIRCTLKD